MPFRNPLPPDYDEVYPGLWVGSRPEPGIEYRNKFDVLVLCAAEYQPDHRYLPQAPMLYHCPLWDFPPGVGTPSERDRNMQNAARCAIRVANSVRLGDKVLVTCMEGRNRSAFVAASAIHILTGRPGWYAMELVRAKRRPYGDPTRTVLFNQDFVRALRSLRLDVEVKTL